MNYLFIIIIIIFFFVPFSYWQIILIVGKMSILRQCGALVTRQLFVRPQQNIALNNSLGILVSITNSFDKKFSDPFGSRGHKKFGHQKERTPTFTKFFHLFLGTLFVITLTDWKK